MTKLSSIKKNNPQFVKDEDLINQFILRQKPYNAILNSLWNYDKESTPQHFLIIGQRGMGKSTLIKRIEIELRRNEQLATNYIPVLLPEEVYNVDKLSKFWLKVIDCVLDYFETTELKSLVLKWESEIEKLKIDQDESEIYYVFDKIVKSLNKKPVILIDNIHLLFNNLSENENWVLRSRLTGNDAPVLISASPTSPDVFSDYQQAFYDYFKIIHLDPISLDEFQRLVKFWVSIEEGSLRNSFIQNNQRLEALFRLSGGNLRTVIMLFVKMADGFGDKIDEDLDNLLDEITPLYKARIEELSEQLRNIIDAIALHWDPIDIKKLEEVTGFKTNVLYPQIKRLRSAGWVTTSEKSNASKVDKYELVERFFNIWHIMRSSTRRSKRTVRGLAGFIEEFYEEYKQEYAHQLLREDKIRYHSQSLLNIATNKTLGNTGELKLSEIQKAKERLKSLNIDEIREGLDSYFLNESLFHVYDLNFGEAAISLKKAIEALQANIRIKKFDDWLRYIVVSNKKGFGSMMLEVLKETDFIIRMRPVYEAAVAFYKKDESYLNDVAAEVRVVAKDILDMLNEISMD
jgi:nucleoside-triphosphatase THEP1/DNA-binding PadR family transcriptional regulator